MSPIEQDLWWSWLAAAVPVGAVAVALILSWLER